MSVMFVDIVGFTSLAERRDIEAVRDLQARYADLARETIERYGGTIEKYIGDAVMAVWGTPVAREDDAERSVRAALDLVAAVQRLEPDLRARAAVMTGEAAAVIGAGDQAMVAGDLINAAARLQALAEPGSVLCDVVTRQASAGAIAFEAAGDHVLRGRQAPLAAHRALRVVARRGGRGRSEELEPTFVGRDADLALIRDMFHATERDSRARLVGVIGQAGIGKSRLAWEFLKYLDGLVAPVYWHEGRSPAYGDGITFWALGEMVRRRAGLAETDDPATTRERIATTVADFVTDPAEREWVTAGLDALLGVAQGPGGNDAELFAAWRTFFERISERGPVVLAFEDLQWADTGLLDFIDHLLDWARGRPLFVLAVARPELLDRRPDWGRAQRSFTSLRLDPIPDPEMRQLVGGVAPDLPRRVVDAIVGRAGGIPLYAVEILRMLLADSRTEAADTAFRPVEDVTDLPLPATLRALVAARLDGLPSAERGLLLDASVIGQSFTREALAAVSRGKPENLDGVLASLARREMVARVSDPQSPERGQWRFVQGLTREVAYSTISRRERLALHLAAARYLEQVGGDEIASAVAVQHLAAFRAADDGPETEPLRAQARLALRAAASRAATLGSHDQAIALVDQALAITIDPLDRADLLERAAESASVAGRHDDAIARWREALAFRAGSGDAPAMARTATGLGRALNEAYRIDEAIAVLEPAAAAFEPDRAGQEEVVLAAQLARAWYLKPDTNRALDWLERVLPAAERLELDAVIADALITRGTIHAFHGRPREGVTELEGGRRIAEGAGLTATVLRALHNLSAVSGARDPSGAFEYARAGLDLALRLGRRNQAAHLLINASGSAFRLGQWSWIRPRVDELLEAEFDPEDRARLITVRVLDRLMRGEPYGEDLAEVERVLGRLNDPQTAANVLELQADVAFVEGRYRESYERAMAIADGLDDYASRFALAGRAALWARDPDRLARALDSLDAVVIKGRILEIDLRCLRIGLALLRGEIEASVRAASDAVGAFREAGLVWDAALYGLGFARAAGTEPPGMGALAADARATFVELGAAPFVAQADSLHATAPARLPGQAGSAAEAARRAG